MKGGGRHSEQRLIEKKQQVWSWMIYVLTIPCSLSLCFCYSDESMSVGKCYHALLNVKPCQQSPTNGSHLRYLSISAYFWLIRLTFLVTSSCLHRHHTPNPMGPKPVKPRCSTSVSSEGRQRRLGKRWIREVEPSSSIRLYITATSARMESHVFLFCHAQFKRMDYA